MLGVLALTLPGRLAAGPWVLVPTDSEYGGQVGEPRKLHYAGSRAEVGRLLEAEGYVAEAG